MVLRQVFFGVSGGSVLAVLALVVSTSGPEIAENAREWARAVMVWDLGLQAPSREPEPTAPPATDGSQEREPTGSDGDRTRMLASLGPGSGLGSGSAGTTEPAPGAGSGAPSAVPVRPEQLEEELSIGALSKQTIIREEPDPDATIIGFVRTGTLLRRGPAPVGHRGCKEGWYRVEPDGYVCVGKAATLDPQHPLIRLASLQADRTLPMPYPYGASRYPTPPLYSRIPTQAEQEFAEQDLRGHLRKNFGAVWEDAADTPPPELLMEGKRIPRPYGYPVLEHEFMTGRAVGSSAFAFIDLFEADGRRWGLTADLALLPLDRLTPIEPSRFSGEQLAGNDDLPLAFVRSRVQYLYERNGAGNYAPGRLLEFREAVHLSGKVHKVGAVTYLETREGAFIKDGPLLVRIAPKEELPKWATGDRSWLDVSILSQTLVAYRGAVPVFATLVSTGKDGLGDPEETHSTARGVFLIHTKHVTSTMSGDEADDEFDLRDVPYVQFFHQGFALHAAFWHDGFGQARSHGCINLSPNDARHLFSLTDPPVPIRWHSALSRDGTLVHVHP